LPALLGCDVAPLWAHSLLLLAFVADLEETAAEEGGGGSGQSPLLDEVCSSWPFGLGGFLEGVRSPDISGPIKEPERNNTINQASGLKGYLLVVAINRQLNTHLA
jgi:hypothetical protein